MSNGRLQHFRSFLTERFTSVAVEIFGEIETIVEAYYEENKHLRNVLHMVLNPEIKLPRIDDPQYTGAARDIRKQHPELNITHYSGAATDVREQRPELNITHYSGAATDVREQRPELNIEVYPEISEPLPKKPKEEEIEHDISLGSEQQLEPGEVSNFIFHVKGDPKEGEDTSMPFIIDSFHIRLIEVNPDSSGALSAVEDEDCYAAASYTIPDLPQLPRSEEGTSRSRELQKRDKKSGKGSTPPELNITQYTGAAADVREQPPELNIKVYPEISEPLPKKPKEEEIEHDISLGSEQQLEPGEGGNFIFHVKSDPKEEEEETSIIDSFHIRLVEVNPDSSGALSADEDEDCYAAASYTIPDLPQLPRSEEGTSRCRELQKRDKKSGKGSTKPKWSLQKTMLELPRMVPFQSFIPDCRSFLTRLTEAFKNFPDDKKPLITKMGLTDNVELVDCAFGKVPKGCPLSYQCPVPSEKDYRIHDNEPPRPLLPLAHHRLKPMSAVPTLSAKEQEHMDVMRTTWEAAHMLEQSTRGRKEEEEKLRNLRLTCRFKEVCKLKPGRTNAEHLIFKIQKGLPRCKSAQIEEEMKAEALREYCKHMFVNWYPCGFVTHPNAPWLGALPDGLVYDPRETNSFGLVHVKCTGFRSFIECKFLFCPGGILKLKRTHSHYWHIQGEMMVTGTEWCDLLVFSREDMLVQRIYRDAAMIKVMKKKLDDFFYYYFLPCLL